MTFGSSRHERLVFEVEEIGLESKNNHLAKFKANSEWGCIFHISKGLPFKSVPIKGKTQKAPLLKVIEEINSSL
jgi:hypothetical protein